MTIFRRFAVLALFFIAAVPQGRAQSVVLSNTNALALYGLTFTVSSCTLNGGSCGSSLELENVAAGRGNIDIELLSTSGTGTPVLSRALNTGSGTSTLQFTLTVSQTAGQPTTMATSAALTETGTRNFVCASGHPTCATGTSATASLNFSNISITTNPLSQSLTGNQSSAQTLTTATDTATADNSFSFVENLTLATNASNNYNAGGTLQLNTVAIQFRAAPEPASIMIMLSAICGVAIVRRRRAI